MTKTNQIPWDKIITIFSGVIICVLIFKIGIACAQWTEWREYVPEEIRGGDLAGYIRAIIDAALILASVVAVIYLIVGGYQYITSSGNAEAAGAAKNTILYAVIGLIIIFAAFVLIDFVMDVITRNSAATGGGTVPTVPTTPPGGTVPTVPTSP